jgi:predicted HD phosphohydrolase
MDERRVVKFRRMADGTEADYKLLEELEHEFQAQLPGRIMKELGDLEHSYSGYQVTRLEHSLISATMAERDKADKDWVVAALIHDIGDALSPANHSQLAASIVAPYVREECTWVLKTHGVFQMVYYAHFTGGDRYARNMYKEHPYYQTAVDFCERWDQSAFDPDYKYEPLAHYEPLIREVFSRPAWDDRIIRRGQRVPMVGSAA